MHIHYRWDDEQKTLLLISLGDSWTWAEYFAVLKEISNTIRQLGYTVDVIVDNTAKIPFPSDSALAQLRRIVDLLPNNLGVIVVVAYNPLIRTLNKILFRIVPGVEAMTALADTLEEGYAVIAQRRAKRGRDHVG